MSRYSVVYVNFLTRIYEVELLRRRAAALERADPYSSGKDINALCRGALVLLCSHLEAYIKELGELALERLVDRAVCRSKISEQFFYHISKDIFDQIARTDQAERISPKVFHFVTRDSKYWKRSDAFPNLIHSERFNKGFSNPNFKKIKSYFRRFGYITYENDINARLTQDASTTINMINQIVATRNLIAHGDPSATKTPTDLKSIIAISTTFCRTTDDVFCTWFKSNLCSLR
jgi:hypothetical protein